MNKPKVRSINAFTGRPACARCSYVGCPGGLSHWTFQLWLARQAVRRRVRKALRRLTALDYSRIEDIEVDGIDHRDAPDFCDAFIARATYKGREMTDAELDRLNEDSDFVYQAVLDRIY